jgi:hypothetical protein
VEEDTGSQANKQIDVSTNSGQSFEQNSQGQGEIGNYD